MLTSQDEEVKTLSRLGLTLCQARVYLSLVRSGMSTVKTISRVSRVPREDIYRITPALQKLGLVEKAITAPVMFKPTPLNETVHILMERKTKEYAELQAKTTELIQNYKGNNARMAFQEEGPQFVLIPKNKAVINKRRTMIENAQTSINIVTSQNRIPLWMLYLAEVINKAMKRGVNVRLITDKPKDENSLPEFIQTCKKNPCFEVRYIPTPPPAVISVYDTKEALIITSAISDPGQSPALWSTNPSLLVIIQDYFEIMWLKSLEHKHEEHQPQLRLTSAR